jgi:hypothetical protein
MSAWRANFFDRCAELDQAQIGEGACGPGPAVWVRKREIAHFDDECTLDVRLTKAVIRARRAELVAEARIELRPAPPTGLRSTSRISPTPPTP